MFASSGIIACFVTVKVIVKAEAKMIVNVSSVFINIDTSLNTSV